jgi:hypothetical protein
VHDPKLTFHGIQRELRRELVVQPRDIVLNAVDFRCLERLSSYLGACNHASLAFRVLEALVDRDDIRGDDLPDL